MITTDKNGNITILSGSVFLDATDNLIIGDEGKKLVAVIGVSNLAIVHCGGATLILPRDRMQDIEQLGSRVDGLLKQTGRTLIEFLSNRTKSQVDENQKLKDEIKRLTVTLAATSSLAESCKEERDKGAGGCGACSICCNELKSEIDKLHKYEEKLISELKGFLERDDKDSTMTSPCGVLCPGCEICSPPDKPLP